MKRTANGEPLTVLVAEDDPHIRELVRARLAAAGYTARTARDGDEALNRILTEPPHLLVLDINMPGLDGFRVLEAMQGYGVRDVQVMVLTARHAANDVRRAMDLGARDFLAKPFSDAQLLARVNRLARPVATPAADEPQILL